MYWPLLLAAWYSSAGMVKMFSVFIGSSWVGFCVGRVFPARHLCFRRISGSVQVFLKKILKKLKSMYKKAPSVKMEGALLNLHEDMLYINMVEDS